MTVIAWDGKTLAADKQVTISGTIFKCTKIERWNDKLIGFTGDSDLGVSLLDWFKFSGDKLDYPQGKDKDNWAILIVISRDGTFCIYERFHTPTVYEPQLFAIGSGMDYAMAAMTLGHTAEEAVGVANKLDTGCGLGCDTLTFSEEVA